MVYEEEQLETEVSILYWLQVSVPATGKPKI